MRAWISLSACLLFACTATLPEGQYRCAGDSAGECPEGWSCVAGRCRSSASPDGAVDRDAGDGDRTDGGENGDAGVDAGGDGGTGMELPVVATLVPSDAPEAVGSEFGRAVDFRGRAIAIGAPSYGAASAEGAVYVFEASGFTQVGRYSVASSGSAELGFDVALSEDYVFAGRPGANEVLRFDTRSEEVFTLRGGGGFYGGSVEVLAPDQLAVGAYRFAPAAEEDVGAVYRLGFDGTPDTEVGRDGPPVMGDVFGSSLAVDDTARWLAVGAPSRGSQPGFVVLHDLMSGLSRRVTSPATGDKFGVSVAFWGDLLAVGADQNTSGSSADGVGRVYLYDVATGAPAGSIESAGSSDRFGASVCAAGTTLLVGAPLARGGRGAVYAYGRTDLVLVAELTPPTDAGQFGRACAANGGTVVIGAPLSGGGVATQTGAAYVFDVGTLGGR
ncbi:MAG: hypothetical protein RLP09_50085 [Sandaracinaceae bacterium]